jgi:para-nitrobenzyl esterase
VFVGKQMMLPWPKAPKPRPVELFGPIAANRETVAHARRITTPAMSWRRVTGRNHIGGYRAHVDDSSSSPTPTVAVVTPYGPIRGLQRDDISVFKSIRYATAARFEPPAPITGWDGELDATMYGPQCPQLFGLIEQALGGSSLPADEDCLSLTVFTPGCDDRARPVVVWIHGGAFTTGTGATPWYDGSELARRGNVVVVTINYRLGAFGFSGRTNCGVLDQITALEWVHHQIAAFGGDPNNVTISGESAGGSSLIALMAAPRAHDLFHRVFAMSPSIGQLRSGDRADEALAEYLDVAGVASLDDLRAAPVQTLLDAQGEILRRNPGAGMSSFSPCTDGVVIERAILDAAADHPAPLVIGTTRDEMLLFTSFNPALADLDETRLISMMQQRFGDRTDDALERYRKLRPDADEHQLLSAVQTDEVFRVPARRLAEARLAAGNPSHMYWFTWASPAFHGRLGSCHAMDIPFAFHNLHRKGVEQFTGDGENRVGVADAYSGALLALAHRSEPGWPPYDLARRPTQVFDVVSELVDDPEPELRELW